ncbi:hypothetical protein VNI00_007139 [Paramarasmius palmivorus]|uniref:Uncharacterized protein n=1 Tax=Paramarasmius palmivorus TaxID=297713 RepID=A0AAW0D6P9_9AGAR
MKTLTKIMQMFGVARKETQRPRQTKNTISKPNPIPETDPHNLTTSGTSSSSTVSATLPSLPPHGKTALRNASRRLRHVGVLPTRTLPLITCQGSICQRCLTLSFKPTPSSPPVTSAGHYFLYEDEDEKMIYFIPVPHPLPDSFVGSECTWRFSPYLGESFCSSAEECDAHALSLGEFKYVGARKFMYTGGTNSGAWALLRSVKVSRHRTVVIDLQTEEHTPETLPAPNEHAPEPLLGTSAADERGDSEEERNTVSHRPLSRHPPKIATPEPCITRSPPGVENDTDGQGSRPLLDTNGDFETLSVTEDQVLKPNGPAVSISVSTSIPQNNRESHSRKPSALSLITEETEGVSAPRTPSTPSSLSSEELTILHTPLAAGSSNELLEVQHMRKTPSLPAVSRFFVNREAVWDRPQKENGDAAILSHDAETLLSETSDGIIQDEGQFSEPEPEPRPTSAFAGRICLDCNTIALGTAAKIGYYVTYPSIDLDTAMLCFTVVIPNRDPVPTDESHEHSWLHLGTLEYRGDTEEEERQYFDRCSIHKYYVKAPEDPRAWKRILKIIENGEVIKLEVSESGAQPSISSTISQVGTSHSGHSSTEQNVTASICLRCGTLYFDPSAQNSDSSEIDYHMHGQYLADLDVEGGIIHFIGLPPGTRTSGALIALRAPDQWAFSASAVRCGPCLELTQLGEMKLLAEDPELILDLELGRRGVAYQQAWAHLFSVMSRTKSPHSHIQSHLCMTCGSMFFGLSMPNSGHGHYLPYMDFAENVLRFLRVPPGIPGTLVGETRSGQWVLTPKDVERQCEHEISELGDLALDPETDRLGHVVFSVQNIRDIPAWVRLLSMVFAAEEGQIHQTNESTRPPVQSQTQQTQVRIEPSERETQDQSKGSTTRSRQPLSRHRSAFVVEERPNPENKLGRRSHMSPGSTSASGSSEAHPFRDRLQEAPDSQSTTANDRADTPMDVYSGDGYTDGAPLARQDDAAHSEGSHIQGHTVPWTPCNQHCTVTGVVPRIDFTWPWENILHLPHPSVPPIYLLGLLAKDRERLFALGHHTVVLYRLGHWTDLVWVPVDESDDTPGSMIWSIVRRIHAIDDGLLWQVLAIDERNWFWHWLPRSAQIAYGN